MHKPTRFLTQHRRARIVAWTLAMLAWIASVLFTKRAPSRRRIRQRYGLFSLRALTRLVCDLATVRALEMTQIRRRPPKVRNTAGAGFRRRTRPRALARAIVGARLRKAFKRGAVAERIQFLIAALSDIDAFARHYFVPRALRRLTKLWAVVPIAPAAEPILRASAPSPAIANSS